jgi:hypothetical protein
MYKVLAGKPEGKRPLGRPKRKGRIKSEWILGVDWLAGRGVDSVGSGYGSVAGSCERGDKPSDSGAAELVGWLVIIIQKKLPRRLLHCAVSSSYI